MLTSATLITAMTIEVWTVAALVWGVICCFELRGWLRRRAIKRRRRRLFEGVLA